jgi:hypothetical protein
MILFALFGIPAFALAAFALERWFSPRPAPAAAAAEDRPAGRPEERALSRTPYWFLLWGGLYAVPCWLLLRPLGRIFPESYRPFLLYLHLLGRDHLFQAGFLALALFSFLRAAGLRRLLFFSAGYWSLLGLGAALAAHGMQDAYELFLLPGLRMSALLLLPFFFARARESSGPRAAGSLVLFALVPLAGALTAWLYARSWPLWAGAAALLLFAGGLASLAYLQDTR